MVIGPDGKVLETHIAQSSGSRALDEAALDAARETTYTPKIVCPYRCDRKPAVQKAAPIPA
ncbi:MAG TPA: TonB family protein [Candidatus Baltobacteraceae bacterium]|nr:TonB family protein [Candidatus Baltobacteraceae bacterium]